MPDLAGMLKGAGSCIEYNAEPHDLVAANARAQ